MDKLRYSVVERKNIDQNAKVMETITIKDGSKKYNATLMFIGKLSKVSHATWQKSFTQSQLHVAFAFEFKITC